MLTPLIKFAAPLVLLFSLVFLTGAVSAAGYLAGEGRADLCCQQGEEKAPSPAADGECSETECRCFSCSVPLLFENPLDSPFVDLALAYGDGQVFLPAEPSRSIDYPPERS